MPKLVNLANIEKFEDCPDFRVPKWMKPEMITDLMRGTISDTEDEQEDDMVHVEMSEETEDAKTDVEEK
jgi:hypothetical protein